MKARKSSPQTSPQIVRRFLVEEGRDREGTKQGTTPTAPRKAMRIEELPASSSMNGFHTYSSPKSTSRDVSPSPGLLTPIPEGVRRVSNGEQSSTTPLRPLANGKNTTLSPVQSSASPAVNGNDTDSPNSQWSSAVGPATTGGKSGRVIERLMAENDRLKRELELQILRVQELEKNAQTYKPQIDGLLEKVDSLSHASTMDSSLIARRDRRIEELREDNAQLKENRDAVASRLRDAERQRDDVEEKSRRDLQSLTESTKHATLHAEILETSHRQLAAEYRARREAWEKDLRAIHDHLDLEQQRKARLDVVYEQMRREQERARKAQADMVAKWMEYEDVMRRVKEEGEQANGDAERLNADMRDVVQQMRWLMGVQNARHPPLSPPPPPASTAKGRGGDR